MLPLPKESKAFWSRAGRPLFDWRKRNTPGRVDPFVDRALALAKTGLWSCDLSTNRLTWTTGVFDLFGLPNDRTPDRRDVVAMYADDCRSEMERHRAHAIAHGGPFTFDARIVRADGEMRWMRVIGEAVRDGKGAAFLHGLKQDVTEEKLRTTALRQLAENDALTGLSSRAVYENRFLNRRDGEPAIGPLGALILFDLDAFKAVNDRFGHAAGDLYLKEFAVRLTAGFPDALLTARIGGDEFAVVLGADARGDAAPTQLAAFLERLRAPIHWRGHLMTIAAASGLAAPIDPYAYDPQDLFAHADAALYATKRNR